MATLKLESGSFRRRITSAPVTAAYLVIAAGLPALRGLSVVAWPWVLVLAPLTAAGVLFCGVMLGLFVKPGIDALRILITKTDRTTTLTPAPEHLAVPLNTDEGILVKYPELLAALCHGFRMYKLQSSVLGRPVTDPWGVYDAALLAGPLEFEQVRMLARRHTDRFAATGRGRAGRNPPDAHVMKQAVQHFRKCAAKTVAVGGNPDCPYEHVTVLFGTRSPNRDAHLKDIAPIVRSLLERQYPALATAELSDGAHVKYTDWQKQATQDRAEVARLRREQERLSHKIEETTAALGKARDEVASLRTALTTARQESRAAGRAEQDRMVETLQATIERAAMEQGRELLRSESDRGKLLSTIDALSAERTALEHALFSDPGEEDQPAVQQAELTGMRILLAGGNVGHVPPIRDYIEAHGVQMLHEDGPGAVEHVAGVHLVVLWTRFMGHPVYFALKRECRLRDVPFCYWTRTSPPSLLAIVMQARHEGHRQDDLITNAVEKSRIP